MALSKVFLGLRTVSVSIRVYGLVNTGRYPYRIDVELGGLRLRDGTGITRITGDQNTPFSVVYWSYGVTIWGKHATGTVDKYYIHHQLALML